MLCYWFASKALCNPKCTLIPVCGLLQGPCIYGVAHEMSYYWLFTQHILLLQKHLTSGTELILTGWKIVPNEEHVQCDHCFASQPLANETLLLSQLCRCTHTGGMRPLLLQHRTISFRLLAKSVNFLFTRSPPCTKVCTKTPSSLLHSLFLRKTIQLSPFDLQSTARCPPFYKLVCWLSAMVNSIYDIYCIFPELQHSLARLQHRYYDVTMEL
jgi:hypothetical protein